MERRPAVRHKRTPYAATVGAVFAILAVVGLVAVMYLTFGMTRGILDNSKKRAEFEKMLLPVVMFDPVPFENISDMDSLGVLQSSLWATLLGDKRGSFQYDELKLLIVPASDVDVAAAKLFGPNVKLEHKSFGDYTISYIYDEELKAYHVPLTGEVGYYTPRVEKIVKKGDTLQLQVGYIPPANVWTVGVSGNKGVVAPDKQMIYELKRNDKNYYLAAIRDMEGATIIPGVPDSQSQPPLAPLAPSGSLSESSSSGESQQSESSGASSSASSGSSSSSSSGSSSASSSSGSSSSSSSK